MNILKGIIIGVAKVVPGLSGTVLMISFNLYDKAILAITRFFDNPVKNFKFLFTLFIGVMIGVVFFSKIISYFISSYYIYTISLFIGLILGGLSLLKREFRGKFSNYLLMLISFFIMISLSLSNGASVYVLNNNYIDILVFLFAGFMEAMGTVLPGVSSTALLMILGVYSYYIEFLGNLFNISYILDSFYFFIPFLVGLVGGVIVISLIINFLFKFYREKSFAIIFGLSISSVVTLVVSILSKIDNILSFLVSISFIVIGYLISFVISE